jgi:hypothetical protein
MEAERELVWTAATATMSDEVTSSGSVWFFDEDGNEAGLRLLRFWKMQIDEREVNDVVWSRRGSGCLYTRLRARDGRGARLVSDACAFATWQVGGAATTKGWCQNAVIEGARSVSTRKACTRWPGAGGKRVALSVQAQVVLGLGREGNDREKRRARASW